MCCLEVPWMQRIWDGPCIKLSRIICRLFQGASRCMTWPTGNWVHQASIWFLCGIKCSEQACFGCTTVLFCKLYGNHWRGTDRCPSFLKQIIKPRGCIWHSDMAVCEVVKTACYSSSCPRTSSRFARYRMKSHKVFGLNYSFQLCDIKYSLLTWQ